MPSVDRSARLLFLACDDRSGSTVTERCLAGVPEICSLGEVHNLSAYVHDERSFFDPPYEMLCTCGARVSECSFWSSVGSRLSVPLDRLKLRVDFPRRTGLGSYIDRARWRAEEWAKNSDGRLIQNPLWHRTMGYDELARQYWELYDAAAEVSGCPVVVDSSKWPLRFNYLARAHPERMSILLMYRSPFAVVYSKMRHTGVSPELAGRRWLAFAQQMERFAEALPRAQVFRLFYEEFCASPEESLTSILQALGLRHEVRLGQPMDITHLHHIGGSPSKFDDNRTKIELDEVYRTEMDADARRTVESIAGSFWAELCSKYGIRSE
ncbi:MAG: sulfotransferase [Pseudomonadota bacterium]